MKSISKSPKPADHTRKACLSLKMTRIIALLVFPFLYVFGLAANSRHRLKWVADCKVATLQSQVWPAVCEVVCVDVRPGYLF
jgi:L-aminopeptidase/D-esterase-like protein